MRPLVSSAAGLFSASFAALYLEVVLIRWLATEVPILGYFKNFPLMAAFVGLGTGVLLAGRARDFWISSIAVLGTLGLAATFSGQLGLTGLIFPDPRIDVWGRNLDDTSVDATGLLLRNLFVIFLLMGACVWSFVGIGQVIGRWFREGPPLRMYTVDVLGSLAGVLLFALLCYLETGPHVWLTVAAASLALAGGLGLRDWRWGVLPVAAVAAVAAVAWLSFSRAESLIRWSPYYRVEVFAEMPPALEGNRPLHLGVDVNRDVHQVMVDVSDSEESRYVRGTFRWRQWQWWRAQYEFPYLFRRDPGDVLIGGAGSGNNAASALRAGARRVTAVEIDPRIIELGKMLHPARPYDSPRVRIVNDDLRAFLRWNDEKYDLIEYGILDSHTALSSLSSLRLENYVYTVEGLRDALDHLAPGGLFCISFYEDGREWIGARLFWNLALAAGRPPAAKRLGPITFLLLGAGIERSVAGARLGWMGVEDASPGAGTRALRPSTDDWPFLYSHPAGQPLVYYLSLLVFVGMAGALIYRAVGRGAGRVPLDWQMFLLGAGFLLVETKALAEMSLLFGSTWIVNVLVLSGVFVMVLLSVWVVHTGAWRRLDLAYAFLAAVLAGWFFFPRAALNELPMGARAVAGTILTVLPVFFAGIVFARSFAVRASPAVAFGSNLLGAVVGGAMEASSLALGIRALTLIALGFYAGSWLAMRRDEGHRVGGV